MTWWLWFVFGCALLVLELFSPSGFYLFVLGLSGILVGLLAMLGLPIPAWGEWLTYALFSIVLLVGLRGELARRFFANARDVSDELTGKRVKLTTEIAAGAYGSGEMRGTVWKVHNAGAQVLKSGSSCPIDRVDGLTLFVSKED